MPSNEQNDIKIMPKAIVCEESQLLGDVTISAGCVIHPSATIIAKAGPIILGENCIVEEYATIVHKLPPEQEASEGDSPPVLSIGNNNVFEVGCTVETNSIGEKNVFECKSYVGPGVCVTNGCIIGAGVKVSSPQELSENTVIYGRKCLQRTAMEKHGSQTLHIDFLRKILPNYHRTRKANHDPKKTRQMLYY